MDENPYQSPAIDTEAVGVRSGKRTDLRSVAIYQKAIIVCILIYILCTIIAVASPGLPREIFLTPAQLEIGALVAAWVAGFVGAVFVVALAIKVYNVWLGLVLGLGTLVPCLGLLVLLTVNGKATAVLRQNGIKVGLMGARLSDV